jgi:hypothetical protein
MTKYADLRADLARAEDSLKIEHEVQRQLLERLHIPWPPGEPFYALIEVEIERLREIVEPQPKRYSP